MRTLILPAVIGALLGLWLNPNRGYTEDLPTPVVEVAPYGGCDEAAQPGNPIPEPCK